MNDTDTRILREPLTAPGQPAGSADTRPLGSLVGAASGPLPGDPSDALLGSLAGSMVGAVLQGTRVSASSGVRRPAAASSADLPPDTSDRPAVDDHDDPAVRYGGQAYARYRGACDWTDVEDELAAGWPAARGTSSQSWDDAAPIAHEAWLRSRKVAKHTLANDSPDQGLQYRAPVPHPH